MSLDLYGALERRSPVNAEALARQSQALAKAAEEEKEEADELSVEGRLLQFLPHGYHHRHSQQPSRQHSQISAVQPPPPLSSLPRVLPSTPQLLSSLHREPSVSRSAVDYHNDSIPEEKEEGEEEEKAEVGYRATAASVDTDVTSPIPRPSKSRKKEKSSISHSRKPRRRGKSSAPDHPSPQQEEEDQPHLFPPDTALPSAPDMSHILPLRSSRSSSQVPEHHRELPPPPSPFHRGSASILTHVPLPSYTSALTVEAPPAPSAEKKRNEPANAFLHHLAGLIKSPQPSAQPPLHRPVEAVLDSPDDPIPTPIPQPPPEPSSAVTRLSIPDAPPHQFRRGRSFDHSEAPSPAVAVVEEVTAIVVTEVEPPPERQREVCEERKGKDEKLSSEDEGDVASSSSSPSTPPPVLSDDGSDDEMTRSLSTLWSSAKRRQDRLLRSQHEATVEKLHHKETWGKSLVTAGLIVQVEGKTLGKEEQRMVRRGKRQDGKGHVRKMTLEERKAVKMAAVYRQLLPEPPPPPPQEQREQEVDERRGVGRRGKATLSHTHPITAPRPSSPSSTPFRRVVSPSMSSTVSLEAPRAVGAFSPAPLQVRAPTDVVFGRTTALTEEEEKAKKARQSKGHTHSPSLFDLAYGSEASRSTASDPPTQQGRGRRKANTDTSAADDDETVPSSGLTLTIPARVLASPGVSSHRVREGIAQGLPLSIIPIARHALTPAQVSAAVVSPTSLSPPPMKAIHHHKSPSISPSTPLTVSSLSHLSTTFSKAPRTFHPTLPTTPSTPPKRVRLAPKTKARLDRLHEAHRLTQARLVSERAAKEAKAMAECTFTPTLAPNTERLAERKRLQDEMLIHQWELIKAKAAERRAQQQSSLLTFSSHSAPPLSITAAPTPLVQQVEEASSFSVGRESRGGSTASDSGEGKRSRAHVMHDQHLLLQERKVYQKALEDEAKAEEEVSECTFDPFAPRSSTASRRLSTLSRRPSEFSQRPSMLPSPALSMPSSPSLPPSHSPDLLHFHSNSIHPRSRGSSAHSLAPSAASTSLSDSRRVSLSEEESLRAPWRQQQHDTRHAVLRRASEVVELDLTQSSEKTAAGEVQGESVPARSDVGAAEASDTSGTLEAFAWTVPAWSTHTEVEDEAVPQYDDDSEADGDLTTDLAELAQSRLLILTQLVKDNAVTDDGDVSNDSEEEPLTSELQQARQLIFTQLTPAPSPSPPLDESTVLAPSDAVLLTPDAFDPRASDLPTRDETNHADEVEEEEPADAEIGNLEPEQAAASDGDDDSEEAFNSELAELTQARQLIFTQLAPAPLPSPALDASPSSALPEVLVPCADIFDPPASDLPTSDEVDDGVDAEEDEPADDPVLEQADDAVPDDDDDDDSEEEVLTSELADLARSRQLILTQLVAAPLPSPSLDETPNPADPDAVNSTPDTSDAPASDLPTDGGTDSAVDVEEEEPMDDGDLEQTEEAAVLSEEEAELDDGDHLIDAEGEEPAEDGAFEQAEAAGFSGEEVDGRHDPAVLLSVDIAIAEDRVERMHLYDGDDMGQAAEAFVALHGLNPAYTSIIEGMLQARLQEALAAMEMPQSIA